MRFLLGIVVGASLVIGMEVWDVLRHLEFEEI